MPWLEVTRKGSDGISQTPHVPQTQGQGTDLTQHAGLLSSWQTSYPTTSHVPLPTPQPSISTQTNQDLETSAAPDLANQWQQTWVARDLLRVHEPMLSQQGSDLSSGLP